jgi:hypothetical protein
LTCAFLRAMDVLTGQVSYHATGNVDTQGMTLTQILRLRYKDRELDRTKAVRRNPLAANPENPWGIGTP